MIGRANIEGSKSEVSKNVLKRAWLPQARYLCGNFSDNFCLKPKRSGGCLIFFKKKLFLTKYKLTEYNTIFLKHF